VIPNLHKDPIGFQAALEFTSRETGFRIDLIEKDYYCSVVLAFLFENPSYEIAFKGGTSLNKVHLGFYRLSEDLDFTIPVESDSSREVRRTAIKPFKETLEALASQLLEFRTKQKLAGTNESRQYNGELEYTSISTGTGGTIKVEVGLREGLLTPLLRLEAQTLLLNPFSGKNAVSPVVVQSLSKDEAYSEKVRAALTRREPAIRDWFDLDHAVRSGGFELERPGFLALVRKKLQIPGVKMGETGKVLIEQLRSQLETELRPVLRERDFAEFDLERAIAIVNKARKLL
jgi:predicted nucleotidyltransferase component of viral defense system